MLRSLTDFIAEIAGGTREAAFAENDYRLAAAALLVHVVTIDGVIGAEEMAKLRRILEAHFSLGKDDAERLLEAAIARDAEAVDLYAFTSVLNRAMDDEGRKRVVALMFEVAYADGGLTEFEDNLVWRAAELLNVSSRDRVQLRKQVRDSFEVDR
ncbi:TerB family tellurite resistance protein [Ancylobacter radicis]|uniref:TerB family tellurite resistance protein n=1 Tax=Ancylobacter radicis TaxID=2836179 RepID=A0ABS5R2U8_9HYPH|nr:TerB family tellurite resistance protein [Ancylobacter radicis]MBS9475988.1 TerB family tellurite resistance protein [Ancylobacter radicis]